MDPAPLSVGLIGYGFAGKTFHAPLIAATDGLELVAIASSRPEQVALDHPGLIVEPTPDALIARADIDLIVIASPNETHAPLARAAIARGAHVVIDKPFALSLDEARGVIAAAEEAGVHAAVFHNRRWDSDYLGVVQAVRDGLIGRVTHVEAHFDRYRPAVIDRWRERAGPGGGIWYDLGPHLADQALGLLGLPDTVSASLAIARDGGQADDWAHAVLDYGEARAVLHASMLVAGGAARFTVHGTGGSIVKAGMDPQEGQLRAGMVPGAPGWGRDDDPLVYFGGEGEPVHARVPDGDQRRFYAGLRDAIRGNAPNPVPPVQALAVMAVIEAGLTSAREGRAAPLPLTETERTAWAASWGED